MKTLLLIAHGSRRESSNEEVRRLAETLMNQTQDFELVEAAYLEIAKPSIPEGLELLIGQGAKEVVVMPHFLAAGRHVVEDIPAEVEPVQKKYAHVRIKIAPHLGASPHLSKAILELSID